MNRAADAPAVGLGDRAVQPPPPAATWRWALAITLGLTLLRLWALRVSPLQLYPDEAQYWVWSRELAFGYFSKPPMIAWIIRLTTAPFGDAETFVRLSSPLLHGAAGLFIYAAGRRLYDALTGLVSLLVYALMPAVQLGAFVVSTDTPLCAFLAAALWLYVVAQQTRGRAQLAAAAGFGLALGLAFLAKYAALYALIGVALHLALARETRRAWSWPSATVATLAFALMAAPNLVWNTTNGFATLAHTADNAAWDRSHLFTLGGLLEFLAAQLAVFGPVPSAVLVGGGAVLAIRRRLQAPDVLLICLTLPPLVIIAAEAFIVRAHANWAATSYVPGSILVSAWLLRWRARRTLALILAVHALLALVFIVGVIRPRLADTVGASGAVARLRGWRELTRMMVDRARIETLRAPLTAAVADDRFLFNEAAYYGRDYFGRDGPPLRAWLAYGEPREAQLSAPLTAAEGGRVLVASFGGWSEKVIVGRFARTGELEIDSVQLDPRHSRRLDLFTAEGFHPAVAPAPGKP